MTLIAHGHPLADARGRIRSPRRKLVYDEIGEAGPHHCHWCKRELRWQRAEGRRKPPDYLNVTHLDVDGSDDLDNLVIACTHCCKLRAKGLLPVAAGPPKCRRCRKGERVSAGLCADCAP